MDNIDLLKTYIGDAQDIPYGKAIHAAYSLEDEMKADKAKIKELEDKIEELRELFQSEFGYTCEGG